MQLLVFWIVWYFAFVNKGCFAKEKDSDPILELMCSQQNGMAFWNEIASCSVLLGAQNFKAMETCLPTADPVEREKTRQQICSNKTEWPLRMSCYNEELIRMQNKTDEHLELSPGKSYRACVQLKVSEAELEMKAGKDERPEFPQDQEGANSLMN